MADRRTAGLDGSDELKRDAALGGLLASADSSRELLSWRAVEQLVAKASPVRVPWYASLTRAGGRPLRYAMALSLLLLMGTGLLAIAPAQSDQVGTLILTKLPSAWQVDGPAFTEVRNHADAEFTALGIPQAEMFVVVGERAGRDELAFVMLGVDRGSAEGFLTAVTRAYPALDAFTADFSSLNTDRFGSRLNELVYNLTHAGSAVTSDDESLKVFVLKTLAGLGFRDVENISIERRADGKIVITIDAALELSVEQGRTQEELSAAGLSEELLGSSEFQRLLDYVAVP